MDSTKSTISNWFGSLAGKASELYNRAKSNVMSLRNNSSAPLVSTTPITTTATTGGSKRRPKKTRRVRFSRRHKVYKFKYNINNCAAIK